MLLNDKIDSAFKDAIDDVFVQNNTSPCLPMDKVRLADLKRPALVSRVRGNNIR